MTMRANGFGLSVCMGGICLLLQGCAGFFAKAGQEQPKVGTWEIGTPIVGYYHGPGGGGERWGPLTHGMAQKLVDGGFTLAWGSTVEDLDVAHAHGLRLDLIAEDLREPGNLDDPTARARIDSVIDSVKDHPALYSYRIVDEPSAARFPEFARMVDYIRERDPAHLAYINLFPTYAGAGNQYFTNLALVREPHSTATFPSSTSFRRLH